MRVREVLALLRHPSVPLDEVVAPSVRTTARMLLTQWQFAPESVLDEPFRLADGREVTAVYVNDTQLRMSDPL